MCENAQPVGALPGRPSPVYVQTSPCAEGTRSCSCEARSWLYLLFVGCRQDVEAGSRGENGSCTQGLAVRSCAERFVQLSAAPDCLQPPVRRRSACNIPIADGKDAEDILGSAAHLNPKGQGYTSLPTQPRTERRR